MRWIYKIMAIPKLPKYLTLFGKNIDTLSNILWRVKRYDV